LAICAYGPRQPIPASASGIVYCQDEDERPLVGKEVSVQAESTLLGDPI